MAQRVVRIGGEVSVNTTGASSQLTPRIATLKDGGWVVTWQDGEYNILQQAFGSDGSRQGAETIVAAATMDRWPSRPDITALSDGGWVVTWEKLDPDASGDIAQQAYNADGTLRGGEITVNTIVAGDQRSPHVTGLSTGGWVVTWEGKNAVVPWDIYQQAFNADGSKQGDQVRVNTRTEGIQSEGALASLSDGGWIVAWADFDSNGFFKIVAQAYDADGSRDGGEIHVKTNNRLGSEAHPNVAGLTDGGWVVSWQGGLGGTQIFQQAYNADGSRRGSETLVNPNWEVDPEANSDITPLSNGGWVVTWQGDDGLWTSGVFQQAYHADGTKAGPLTRMNAEIAGHQNNPGVAALSDGSWIAVWEGDGNTISQQHFGLESYVNAAPTGVKVAGQTTFSVLENTYSHVFGTLSTEDANADDTFTYQIVDSAGNPDFLSALFIEEKSFGSGVWTLRLSGWKVLDYEAYPGGVMPARIKVTDADGASHIQDITINILDDPTDTIVDDGGSEIPDDWDSEIPDDFGGDVFTPQSLFLVGTAGRNRLIGGQGNDLINGKAGKDVLTGGRGKDIFIFDTKIKKGQYDQITDFNVKDDTIAISLFSVKSLKLHGIKKGKLAKKFFAFGTQKDKDDQVFYNKKSGFVSIDADGNGPKKGIEIVKLKPGLKLTANDFLFF